MSTENERTDRFHHDPVTGEHPNASVDARKHDADRDRGAAERTSLEVGDAGVQVAHGVTSALKDLGHAGADIGLAVAHGVTGSLTDMGHAVENVGRAFESEETRARHDAHHNQRIDAKYDAKIAHDQDVDEREAEHDAQHVEHKEAKRQRHIAHLEKKGAEPYKIEDAKHSAEVKNAKLEAAEAHKSGHVHDTETRKEERAEATKQRKER